MNLETVICTLFEGDYHYGVASLVNSLYKQGYRGDIYAGYRGALPLWANELQKRVAIEWEGGTSYEVVEGLNLHFLPLETNYHFTNFKPDFMLLLWNSVAKGAKQMFYFDPDIVVVSQWSFFSEWVSCGVALCEDVNSPLTENHPRRVAWRRYFSSKGINLYYKDPMYVNGGFIGVENKNFLILWKKIQELMASQIGGLDRSSLNGTSLLEEHKGPLAPFSKTDQDALNATLEAWDDTVSLVGQEGMAFKPGTVLMPHALGHPKPWRWKPFTQAMNGKPPRLVDRVYWNSANGIIVSQPTSLVSLRKYTITFSAFVGRFYRKGQV